MSNPIEFTVERNMLKAALACAASRDVRFYLCGVLIEIDGDKGFIVSTNGHVMFVARFMPESPAKLRAIIPRELIENKFGREKLTVTTEGKRVSIADGAKTHAGDLIDGTFPEWRAVVPSNPSGEPGQYAPEYLALIAKVAKLVGTKYPAFNYGGRDKSAISVLDEDSIFVVMPVRVEAKALPAWVSGLSAEAKAA